VAKFRNRVEFEERRYDMNAITPKFTDELVARINHVTKKDAECEKILCDLVDEILANEIHSNHTNLSRAVWRAELRLDLAIPADKRQKLDDKLLKRKD